MVAQKKKKRPFNSIMNVCIFILVLIILICAFFMLRSYKEYKEGIDCYRSITNDAVENLDKKDYTKAEYLPIRVNFNCLQKINKDICGWLYCKGTNINYPVVKTDNNQYYLHHLVNGKENSSGTLFVDCNNKMPFQDDNTIIYGHNMKNQTMFGSIDLYDEISYYKKHKTFYFFTAQASYRIELTSGYTTSEHSSVYKKNFKSGKEKQKYLTMMYNNSAFRSAVPKDSISKLVTLSTCAYDYRTARFVVQGKVIKMK